MTNWSSPLRDLVVSDVTYYQRQPFAPDASDARDRWLQLPDSSNVEQVADLLAPQLQRGGVVDPFAGAGSTLVAAQRLGNRAVGVERHPIAFSGAYAKATLGPAMSTRWRRSPRRSRGVSVAADGEALGRVVVPARRTPSRRAVGTYVGARLESVTDVATDARAQGAWPEAKDESDAWRADDHNGRRARRRAARSRTVACPRWTSGPPRTWRRRGRSSITSAAAQGERRVRRRGGARGRRAPWVRYGGPDAAPVTTDGPLPETSDLSPVGT